MNAITSPLNPLVSTVSSDELAHGIARQIVIREKMLLQARFLELLQEQPFSHYFTLCGEAALHGVYLHARRCGGLEFDAPPAIASRFGILARAFGEALQPRGASFVFTGKISVAKETQIPVTVAARRPLPLPPENRLFMAATYRTVKVRAAPLLELVDALLTRVRREPRPMDLLDLWFCLKARSQSGDAAGSVWNSFHGEVVDAFGPASPVSALTVEQLRHLRRTWQPALRDAVSPIPPLVRVFKDLQEWRTLPIR